MVAIEVQDQFGQWHRFTTVLPYASAIAQALKTALKSQLASNSEKARAVDQKTGRVIDFLQG